MNGDDSCVIMEMYLISVNYTFKNNYNSKFYIMYIFLSFKKVKEQKHKCLGNISLSLGY